MSASVTLRHPNHVIGRTRRPSTTRASVTPANIRATAAAVLRQRWPELDLDYVAWRVQARYRVQPNRSTEDVTLWTRSAVYELVVEDQRADRGQTGQATELATLLCQLAGPTPSIGRGMIRRATTNLHPRDVAIVRLLLAGHRFDAVAQRFGLSVGAVEQAYGRVRARLRATIETDPALRTALSEAREAARVAARVRPLRSTRRPAPLDRYGRPVSATADAG
jgi:DNA-binding CsgD family transcriptional regulator